MAGTRSSARQAAQNSSSPPSAKSSGGTKRKADASSPASATKSKRGRPSKASKEQKTLEETMPQSEEQGNTEMKQAEAETDGGAEVEKDHSDDNVKEAGDSFKGENKEGESMGDPEKALKDSRGGAGLNALDQVKADVKDPGKTSKEDDSKNEQPAIDGADAEPAIEEEKSREQAQPENVMEKGVIYFFSRGRVGIDDPSNPQEIQRSYAVMRPLPPGGKITDGAVQDASNIRLIALPKKVWPKSGRDRFMAYVEKAGASMDTLREEFFQGSEYSTKTTGTRHTPAVTPIGEGVYAISYSGEGSVTTHLSYMMTIPQEIGDVQKDIGLAEQGSFILSSKNPESSAPSYALPANPEYPKEILEEFGSRGWLSTKPHHLDYDNAAFLIIGESSGLDHVEAKSQDEKDENKETPVEEMEELEHENEIRIEHMKGDDTIFADLGVAKKNYPAVKTTW